MLSLSRRTMSQCKRARVCVCVCVFVASHSPSDRRIVPFLLACFNSQFKSEALSILDCKILAAD
jgi:hypothetical protein